MAMGILHNNRQKETFHRIERKSTIDQSVGQEVNLHSLVILARVNGCMLQGHFSDGGLVDNFRVVFHLQKLA